MEFVNGINVWAALAAGVAGWLWGATWYAPPLFAKAWQREVGLTDAQLRSGSPAMIFGTSMVLCLLSALVFALFLGPKPGLGFAVGAGFAAGLFWVAASFGVNYLFARRSFRLFLIDGGFHTLQFTIYGLVLGLWH